jgi:hypothetical protein
MTSKLLRGKTAKEDSISPAFMERFFRYSLGINRNMPLTKAQKPYTVFVKAMIGNK